MISYYQAGDDRAGVQDDEVRNEPVFDHLPELYWSHYRRAAFGSRWTPVLLALLYCDLRASWRRW